MSRERHVRLYRSGRNQVVRVPKEFELDAQEAIMRREDDRLVIEPVRKRGLLATLGTLRALDEEFPEVDAGLPALDDVAGRFDRPIRP